MVQVGHSALDGGELRPIGQREALRAVIDGFPMAVVARFLHRFFPCAAGLSRLPGWELLHGADPSTRLAAAGAMLEEIRFIADSPP